MRYMTLVVILTLAAPVLAENRLPQGGGVLYPAWTARFWDNPTLSGQPRWEQTEIRVRFDWEDWRPVVGTRSERMRGFPIDGFSARFTGQLLVRFAEPYTFHLKSDERARLLIREAGAEAWQTLIDAWAPHPRRTDKATVDLEPGKVYDVQIDYADLTGDAVCELRWSSPSTPIEVVDYLASTSIHADPWRILADHNAMGPFQGDRYEDGPDYKPTMYSGDVGETDENGWPLHDFSITMSWGFPTYPGHYLLQFKGQAEVSIEGTFEVDGQRYETLPKGVGYDAATNTTRAILVSDGPRTLKMTHTQRTADSPENTGVTDVKLMRPRKINGTEPHAPGEAANGEWIEAMRPYVSMRFQSPGLSELRKWEHRSVPTFSRVNQLRAKNDFCIETAIQVANECGRDLHYNFSGSCDEQFMHKMALAAKYGTDGREPYTKPTPNPAYPPLDSNLRLYLEHGNEMGWSAIQPRNWVREDLRREAENNTPVWQAVNFDHALNSYQQGAYRYHGYRTALMSLAMREVFGADGMGEVVRMTLFGQ